jgi:hypothetical protein
MKLHADPIWQWPDAPFSCGRPIGKFEPTDDFILGKLLTDKKPFIRDTKARRLWMLAEGRKHEFGRPGG